MLLVAAVTAVLAMGAGSVLAAIIAVTPDVVLFTPADVRLNQTQSNVQIDGFDEQQCIQLGAPLQTDQGFIPAQSWVSCHFFHMDPVTSAVLDGKARFDGDILGVISSSALLDASEPTCQIPNVTYPVAGAEVNRGLEAFQPNDRYQIIDAGRGIHIEMDVPFFSFTDQIRVITCCPGHECGD